MYNRPSELTASSRLTGWQLLTYWINYFYGTRSFIKLFVRAAFRSNPDSKIPVDKFPLI